MLDPCGFERVGVLASDEGAVLMWVLSLRLVAELLGVSEASGVDEHEFISTLSCEFVCALALRL